MENLLISSDLQKNIDTLHRLLPLDKSFDLITRDLTLVETKAYWIGVNGFCKTDMLFDVLSNLQDSGYMETPKIENLRKFISGKISYAQIRVLSDWDSLIKELLSGPSLLFIDGFEQALVIDARTYPNRSISEPTAEQITVGSRDGFIETMLTNANLLRRRVRSKDLTFETLCLGSESKTDVALAYLGDSVNQELLKELKNRLEQLKITSLTMGAKSLAELLIPRRWWNPLPSIQFTQRPDVASSYLMEGHILILVDNSPLVLILPCTIFQFTQSPEDYYQSPLVGSYFRFIRFACIPVTLLLMPTFLLLTAYFPEFSAKWQLLADGSIGPVRIIFYVFAVELILDLFKYSASLSSGHFSDSLSIVGGLIIGDIAVNLKWASTEVLFYGAISLLAALSISSIEFANALKLYRIFLLIATACFGLTGFLIGLVLILISMATTPTFGGMSYLWPLLPWNWQALKKLLFRCPTSNAQPSRTWYRGPVQNSYDGTKK